MTLKTRKEMLEEDNPVAPMRPGSKGAKKAQRKLKRGDKKKGGNRQ